MPFVVGYENEVVGQGRGPDHQVGVLERGPLAFQIRFYHAESLRNRRIRGQYPDGGLDTAHSGQARCDSLRFVCPLIQLHKGYGAYAQGVVLVARQVFENGFSPFEAVDQRVRVEKVHHNPSESLLEERRAFLIS